MDPPHPFDIKDIDIDALFDLDLKSNRVERIKLDDLQDIDWEQVATSVLGILDPIAQLKSWISGVVSSFVDIIKRGFGELISPIKDALQDVWNTIKNIPSVLANLISKLDSIVISPIKDVLGWIDRNFGNLVSIVTNLVNNVSSYLANLPSAIKDMLARIGDAVGNVITNISSRIESVFTRIIDALASIPDTISNIINRITTFVSSAIHDIAGKIQAGLSWLVNALASLPDTLSGVVAKIVNVISGIAGNVTDVISKIVNMLSNIPQIIDKVVTTLISRIEAIGSYIGRLGDSLSAITSRVEETISRIVGNIAAGIGGVVEWTRRGFETLSRTISSWFDRASSWFESATAMLKQVGSVLTGFVNAVLTLPERLYNIFIDVVDFFRDLKTKITNIPNVIGNLVDKLLDASKTIVDKIMDVFAWLWDKIVSGVTWIGNKVVDLGKGVVELTNKVAGGVVSWFKQIMQSWVLPAKTTAPAVEQLFQEAIKRTGGVAENLWIFGGSLVVPYWEVTVIPLMIRGLARGFGDAEIEISPSVAGTRLGGLKYKVKLGELADALARGFETYYSGYAIGIAMALANNFFVNMRHLYVPRVIAYYDTKMKDLLQDLFTSDELNNAEVNMFIRPLTEAQLFEYSRRSLALAYDSATGYLALDKLARILNTTKIYLTLTGLPKWYVDFMVREPEKLATEFVDRFGAKRKIYLSPLFELPTHSELARMTQRDIFPSLQEMIKVAWIRGWNPDLTTLMYLLTFNYPSFEKLWSFYMRALAGMLWFTPPDTIKQVFDKEAESVKAGKPLAPYQLQLQLRDPESVKAFETALNTYFKWIQYSNFSWFTPETKLYNVNVGAEIYSKLGGWTADSWLLADVSADIPTKIDMRWMSRFGIFLHMSEKLSSLGVAFESYTPMVDAVPKLLDGTPATPIQVDLRWFSKLLQATGLHPAWVPITTVAENIMVIADEMTLLRTGWLNLFKEGMITVEDVERYLSGMIVTSYRVGYWDPVKKVWTSGWINLPVRWLPHERRLLQLRMTMDRILDVFREIYSYIRSGLRTLALTPDEAQNKLKTLVDTLRPHYAQLTKQITGIEMTLNLDENYLTMWLEAQKLAWDIEANERLRYWWMRVSGWILYRVAYGYVTPDEINSLITSVGKLIPLHPKEIEAYKQIAQSLLGIARKEAIPSPSTLAAMSEYMVIPTELIQKVLSAYNIPTEYWSLWSTYIVVRPLKADYKAVINTALKALRYGVITQDTWNKILSDAKSYGFTDAEISLLQLRSELELMIESAREYIPTPTMLAAMSEYLPEVRQYIEDVLDARRIKGAWRELWTKYIYLRPVYDNVREWSNAMLTLARYFIISNEQLKPVFDILKTYGWEELEIIITQKTLLANQIRVAFNYVIGTPRNLVALTRYTDKAVDQAFTRVSKLIDALPIDNNTKELLKQMWREYIIGYQAYPEIRSYITELINAYAYGLLDDAGLEQEFNYLRKLGVPEMRLALAKRTAQLRRNRYAYMYAR
jgi:phage-related minor tail protein